MANNTLNGIKSNPMDITLDLNIIGKQFLVADKMDRMGYDARLVYISNPGFSKTGCISGLCEALDYNCTTILPTNYGADEITGFSALVKEDSKKLAPTWYKSLCALAQNGKRNVLFIDELGASYGDVQASLLKVLNEKRLDENMLLPPNTMVVAAANFGKNYDNGFHLQDATLNRCLIVNLLSEDFPWAETIENSLKITKTRAKGGRVHYNIPSAPIKKVYDYELIEKFVLHSGHFDFMQNDATPIEDFQYGGTLGCASIRSATFMLLYIESYLERFQDDCWVRVAGDTIGISHKTDKPYSLTFKQNLENFLYSEPTVNVNDVIGEIAQMMRNGEFDENLIDTLYESMSNCKDLATEVRQASSSILNHLFRSYGQNEKVVDVRTLWEKTLGI